MIGGVSLSINGRFSGLIVLFFFYGVHGLRVIGEPNKTTLAFSGSNVTLTWNLVPTDEDKKEEFEVRFGTWNKRHFFVERYLKIFTLKPNGQEEEATAANEMAKRWTWTGNLSHNYVVAFQLTNVQQHDIQDYGVRFRVDHFPATIMERGPFSLLVEDPPVKPTADTRNITLEVVEGDQLNITCRVIFDGNPLVVWTKDNIPVHTAHSKVLIIDNANRTQSGNYACVSMSSNGNMTSAITTVNVFYAPRIHSANKTNSVIAKKGIATRLRCEADGNPRPTFLWRKNHEPINTGFNSTWNSTTLTTHLTGDEDFVRFVCTARNSIGWDSVTFFVHEKVTESEPAAAEAIKSAEDDDDESKLIKYVSMSSAMALILLCALLVVMRYRRRAKNRTNDSPEDPHAQSSLIGPIELSQRGVNPMFSGDLEWEIPPANLNVEKVVGRGAFGVVSRGMAKDLPGKPGWTVVAVKSIQEDASEKERRDLLSEMAVLKSLDPHPHVIRLYGCVSTSVRPLVVVEYAEYGDLLGYLRKSRGVRDNYYSDPSVKPRSSLTSRQLLKFAWEIGDGMDYLSLKKIIHRDLAARNVLVGEEEVCKITDFGMARDVQEEDIYVRTHEGRLPIKWTAPEALFGSGAYTTASDVWSYGVVLYEIFTVGGDPFPGVYMRDIPTLLKSGYRMARPKFINSRLYEIMKGCWESDSSNRPNFGCLRSTFHKLMEEEEQEYINLEELLYENVLPSSC